jgi:quercetin dioxygenase-like cupin family protein
MTIKNLKLELDNSSNPIVKSLHGNHAFRVLIVGFKKGMVMKDHKAKWDSKLTVLEGSVTYVKQGSTIVLEKYNEYKIPVDENHSIIASLDSICILTQSDEKKS